MVSNHSKNVIKIKIYSFRYWLIYIFILLLWCEESNLGRELLKLRRLKVGYYLYHWWSDSCLSCNIYEGSIVNVTKGTLNNRLKKLLLYGKDIMPWFYFILLGRMGSIKTGCLWQLLYRKKQTQFLSLIFII